MPEQSTSTPMLAIKAAIPKRIDIVCFLRKRPFALSSCVVPESVLSRVSLGHSNDTLGNLRNPLLAAHQAWLRDGGFLVAKTTPAGSATADVAIASLHSTCQKERRGAAKYSTKVASGWLEGPWNRC